MSTDVLIDELWPADPPRTASNLVHGYVAQLRRALAGGPGEIVTQSAGYQLRVPDGTLDLDRFNAAVSAAHDAHRQGDLHRAVDLLQDALLLWRGPTLANVLPTAMIEADIRRLEERRLSAMEERFDLALQLGRHADVIGELYATVEAMPLRERLRGQLMVALYRLDRQAEALRSYQDLRRLLADELGVDPGPALQNIHQAILRNSPDLKTTPVTVGHRPQPNHLPRDVSDFTGRERQTAELTAALRHGPAHVAVAAISGKGGVGKTALAVHVAHSLRREFPDGQLFLNLGGLGGQPVFPAEALMRLLLMLGFPRTEIPRHPDARGELFRSTLAGRRLLVVLDNAAHEAQVRPMLPVGTGSAVLLTSRRILAGVESAHQLSLDELDPDESIELLGRVAGRARLSAEPEAAGRIVELCGRLPLALRIAGARLAVKLHWSLGELVDRLAEEKRRLDELQVGDLAVRASFALSFEALDEPARQVFVTLGVLHAADFPAWVPATMLGRPVPDIRDALERLVDAQLLGAIRRDPAGRHRYRLHDLLAVFARERLDQADGPGSEPTAVAEKQIGLGRAMGGWLTVLDSMEARLVRGIPPATPDVSFPLGWLPSQIAALRAAPPDSPAGVWDTGWAGILTLVGVSFELWSQWDDWRMTKDAARAAGRRVGDRLSHDGRLRQYRVLPGRADPWSGVISQMESSEAIFEELGEWRWHAAITVSLGNLYRANAQYDRATNTLARGVEVVRGMDHPGWEAAALFSFGSLCVVEDRLSEAVARYTECLAILDRQGNRLWRAHVLRALGYAYQQHGRFGAAAEALASALPVLREQDDPMWVTHTELTLARAEVGLEQSDAAAARVDRCVADFRRHGDTRSEAMALRVRASAVQRRDPVQALTALEESLHAFERIEDPVGVAYTLRDLADRYRALGRTGPSEECDRSSRALLRDLDLPRRAPR